MGRLYFVALIILSLCVASCGDKKSSSAKIEVTFGALIGATFSGGALVKAVNVENGNSEIFELVPPYNVILPFGVWNLYIVGFEGASDWQGPHQCGGISNFNFAETNQKVSITVDTATCAIEPYLTLKNSKAGSLWDVAVWDSSTWE